jgi:hypothetical protein
MGAGGKLFTVTRCVETRERLKALPTQSVVV